MWDYHMHSRFSTDSRAKTEDMAAAAAKLGYKEICFTEHIDFLYPIKDAYFEINLEAYYGKLESVRRLFPKLVIKTGLEAGVTPENAESTRAFLESAELDFIICSTHVLEGEELYFMELSRRPRSELYRAYLEAVLSNIKAMSHFCVLGHINYPSKLPQTGWMPMTHQDAPDVMDEIFTWLARNGKGMELNTSCCRGERGFGAAAAMLRRYRELGGEIVTIGSDAHHPGSIGVWNKQGLEAIKSAGFRHITLYDRLKPRFEKIP